MKLGPDCCFGFTLNSLTPATVVVSFSKPPCRNMISYGPFCKKQNRNEGTAKETETKKAKKMLHVSETGQFVLLYVDVDGRKFQHLFSDKHHTD